MADGSTKAIQDLQEGDWIKATDVELGVTRDRQVTDTRNHEGDKKLVTLTLDIDGSDGDATGKVTSTAGHHYWLPDAGRWVTADTLKSGMWLRTSSGVWVQITAVEHERRHERVYNLTVDADHNYYILVGGQTVLVHNECPDYDELAGDRAKQLHEGLKDPKQEKGGWAYENDTTAVVLARDQGGNVRTIVASNRKYVPKKIKNQLDATAGDVFANGKGHAEMTALDYMDKQGWEFLGGGANRNVCPPCENSTRDRGMSLRGPKFLGRLKYLGKMFNYMGERIFR